MSNLAGLRRELRTLVTPERAKAANWFFKTGEGQYGAGDQFIGVKVPDQRALAKKYKDLPLADTEALLTSPIHEERLVSLFILVGQYQKGDEATRQNIYDFYMAHTKNVNNWDLVDSSAAFIVGPWLEHRDRSVLAKLATSPNIWERRIAMLSTFYYIRGGDSAEAFKIAELLLHDKEDLIHKAVGWMLREVGKRCGRDVLVSFLKLHYKTMPRTTLRYAIEHFDTDSRQRYLKGLV